MAGLLIERMLTSLLLKPQSLMRLAKPVSILQLRCAPSVKFFSQNRLLYKDTDIVNHTCEILNYNEYIKNYKPTLRIIIQTLCEILNTTSTEANQIIANNPQLKKRSRANILDNYYYLIETGVEKSIITKNPWLLTHEGNTLKNKLNCINVLNMDNNQLIPLLRLTQKELTNYVFYIQNDMDSYKYNKLEYLSNRLECSIEKICERVVQIPFLLKFSVSCIEKRLEILHEYNISNSRILNDLWVLRYSENHIRQRCELYKDTEDTCIKTWAIRCSTRVIERAIQRNKTKRNIMGQYKSVEDYLINKLKVDEKTFESLIAKSPAILRVNLAKMDGLITLLHENGITTDEILKHERIFFSNIETLQNRIKILKKEDIVPKLSVLAHGQIFKQYMQKNYIQQTLLQGNKNVKEYLMHKLDVDEKFFKIMITKRPTILRVNLQKLNELIDLMQQNGITGEDILLHAKIFYFKTETLRKRIETLKEINIQPNIHLLMYSNKYFDKYVESHKSDKLKNI